MSVLHSLAWLLSAFFAGVHWPFGGDPNPHAPFEKRPGITNAEVEALAKTQAETVLTPGGWLNAENLVKIENVATLEVRNESNKTIGRIRGVFKVKALEEVKTGEQIAGLRNATKPAKNVRIFGWNLTKNNAVAFLLEESTALKFQGQTGGLALAAGDEVSLDASWSMT